MKQQGASALRWAKRPDAACPLVLVFGDDEGVVADTANAVIAAWQAEGPSSVRSLDEDDIKREPGLLFDELQAQSLLGEATILRIRTRGEKLFSVLKDVLALAQDTPERLAARVIVQNGSLNTRSKLRTGFEAASGAMALHVFADSDADMASLVRRFLQERDVQIEDAALSRFVGGLPGHRSLANAEMEKLAVYAYDLGRPVNSEDVQALCETNADESMREAVLSALSGDSAAAQAELDRVIDAGLSPISLVRLFEREAGQMLAAHAIGAQGGAGVGMKLKPPVWKSEWPAFAARLKLWPVPRLLRLIERLHDLEALAKSQGGAGMAGPAARALFISLSSAAAQARQ